jgi:hypothetical protein
MWQTHFNFQNLRLFPKRNRRKFFAMGNNSSAERKMLSSERIGLSKKAKGGNRYEFQEQQPAEYPPGP